MMEKEYIDTIEEIHKIANKYIKLLAPPRANIQIMDSTHICKKSNYSDIEKKRAFIWKVGLESDVYTYICNIYTKNKHIVNKGHGDNPFHKVYINKHYYNCVYCDKYNSITKCKCSYGCIFCKPEEPMNKVSHWILPGNSAFKEKEYIEAQKGILSDIERYQALYKKIDTIIRK